MSTQNISYVHAKCFFWNYIPTEIVYNLKILELEINIFKVQGFFSFAAARSNNLCRAIKATQSSPNVSIQYAEGLQHLLVESINK